MVKESSKLIGLLVGGAIGFVGLSVGGTTFISKQGKLPFENSKWASVPSVGEVWNSYLNEDIGHSGPKWTSYQEEITKRNRHVGDWKNFRGERIELPDLDGDGFVTSGKERYSIEQ